MPDLTDLDSTFEQAAPRDLEGVVAKLKQAPYGLVDGRSPWVKIKNREYTQAMGRHEQFQHSDPP